MRAGSEKGSDERRNGYLTPEDIAKIAMVNVATVRRWLRNGEIEVCKIPESDEVKSSEFQKYIKENEIG